MTDRDPADTTTTAMAVNAWLRALRTIGATSASRDEADVALEQVLLTQGVLSPADVVETIRSHSPDTVRITLNSDTILVVSAVSGDVAVF